MRVNISARGSVIAIFFSSDLPARFNQSRDLPFAGGISKANPTHPKAPEKSSGPTAHGAAVILPNLELVGSFRFDPKTFLCQ
jgi:hypothetical protein